MIPNIGFSSPDFFSSLLMMDCTGKGKCLDLDVSNIDFTCITIDKGECCLDRIEWHLDLTCPLIGSATRKKADDARMPFRLHHSVYNFVEGAIASMSDNEIVALSGRF